MNHFKEWMIMFEAQADAFNKLVDEIYNNVIANRSWQHKDLEDNFYHYLTAGLQGMGWGQYKKNNMDNAAVYKQYQPVYQKIKSNWRYDNTAWNYVNGTAFEQLTRKGAKDESEDLKRYLTLKEPRLDEMVKLDKLFSYLLAIPSVYAIKWPVTVYLLMGGIDNVVIYFHDRKDVKPINEAINKANIQTVDRSQFHRQDFGVDQLNPTTNKKNSDTEIASKFFVQQFRTWVNQIIPQTNNTALNYLKSLPMDKAKKELATVLDVILKQRSPHRTSSM
jgi:hypothetical protein